jgi:hypothetical protein
MTDREFETFVHTFRQEFQKLTPKDTGNLRYNAVKLVFSSPTRAVLYVDEKVAPYMPYTDRPWLSPKWGGKKNPNENWFEMAVEKALKKATKSMKGKIKKQ